MSTVFRAVIKLLIGILIFVGLPLLGWGVTDIRGFYSHPARLSYALLSVLLQACIVAKIPGVGRNRGKGKKSVARQRIALVMLQMISLIIVIVAPYCDRRNILVLSAPEIVRYFGLVMFLLGFIAMSWAEAKLDRQFSLDVAIQEGHRLVTDGLYRYLRHPRYLGIIMFSLGFSFLFRSGLTLILVAAITLILLWRIQDEEALLHQEFGADWEAYSRKSWRLIPFLY